MKLLNTLVLTALLGTTAFAQAADYSGPLKVGTTAAFAPPL